MKLTKNVKKEIDGMTVEMIAARFRFFPTLETTGESGRYMQERAREIVDSRTNSQRKK